MQADLIIQKNKLNDVVITIDYKIDNKSSKFTLIEITLFLHSFPIYVSAFTQCQLYSWWSFSNCWMASPLVSKHVSAIICSVLQ